MVTAYSMIANGGRRVKPTLIEQLKRNMIAMYFAVYQGTTCQSIHNSQSPPKSKTKPAI
jgi:membrane carboxypeptidase/penicillin-binding protein